MANKQEQQPGVVTRRYVNGLLAKAALALAVTPPYKLSLPWAIGTERPERPRTWETFAPNISALARGYGIDIAAGYINISGLETFTTDEREKFRKMHLASQERTLQAYQTVVTEENRELIPKIFLTPQIGLTLTRANDVPEDGAATDPRTVINPDGSKAYTIESHYGVGMIHHLFMVPNEQVHQTYAVKPYRDRHPQIGDALYELVSNCGSFDTALNIDKVPKDIRLDYPFAQLWYMYRQTTTRNFVPFERNDDYRYLVSVMEKLMNPLDRDRALVILRESVGLDVTNHVLHSLQAGELNNEMLRFGINMLDANVESRIAKIVSDMTQKGYLPPDGTPPPPNGLLQIAAFEHSQRPEEIEDETGQAGRFVMMISCYKSGDSYAVVDPQKVVSARVLNSSTTVDIPQIQLGHINGSKHPVYFIPSIALSSELQEGQVMEFTVETNGVQKKHNLIWNYLGETPATSLQTTGQTAAALIEEMR